MKKNASIAFVLMCLLVVFATGCSTNIHSAARNGNVAAVSRFLQEGAEVNARDTDGRTPLMYAARNSRQNTTIFLVDKGADVNASDKDKWTPLMFAVAGRNSVDTVITYLVDKGADVNAVDVEGRTALQYVGPDSLIRMGNSVTLREYLKQHDAKYGPKWIGRR